MTVIIPEEGGGDAGTAFAAGVAAAEAQQAQSDAAEAAAVAEAAADLAAAAVDIASSAESDRWATAEEIAGLRGEVAMLREDLAAMQTREEPPVVTVDDLAPEVVDTPSVEPEKPEKSGGSKRSGYGAGAWFGGKK